MEVGAGPATSSGATTSGSPFSATTGDLQGNSYLLCQYYNYETPQKCLQQPASPESSPPIFVEQPLKKSESLKAAADKDQGGAAAMKITPAGGNASGNGAVGISVFPTARAAAAAASSISRGSDEAESALPGCALADVQSFVHEYPKNHDHNHEQPASGGENHLGYAYTAVADEAAAHRPDRTRGPARGDPHLDPTHAGSPLRPKSPAPSSAPSSPDTGADSPSLTTTTIIPEQLGKLHTLRSSSSSRARSRSGSNLPPESEIDGTPRPPHNKSPRPPRAASSTSRDRFQSYFPASTPKLGFEFDFDRITEQSIDALVERVKTNPDETLPEEFVKSLIRRTERLYERLYTQPLVHLEPPANGRMVIVGDTHGQLEDLFWIVFKYGRPSPTNVYFFNGDMVDRGSRGTEILILMYAFHLWDPACIHVNRGNHEDANMNERDRSIGGGFAQECRGKYGNAIYASIQRTFNLMPLGTVVSHKLLIIHGGLFRCPGVTLQHINRVNRVRPCPEHPNTVADWIFFDSLWSDPNPGKAKGISKRGDDCFSFGSETTRRFLKENNLHMVVRSHELPSNSRGFQVHHDSKLITIFSASNYCGTSANYGAVMLLQPSLEFEIFEHWAPELQEIVDLEQENQLACKAVLHTLEDLTRKEETYRNHMRRKSACQLETEIITKLKVKICEKKEELAWWFTYNNSSASGSSGGVVSAKSFRSVTQSFDLGLTDSELNNLFHLLSGGKEQSCFLFLCSFEKLYRHSLPPTSCISSDYRTLLDGDDRLDGLALMLYHNRRGLRRALQHFDPKSSYLVKRKHFRYALQGLAVANCANKHRNILSSLGGGGGGAGGMKTLDAIWGDFLGQLKTVELLPEPVADEVDLAIDHGPAPGAAAGAGGSVEAPPPPPGAAGASVVATKTPDEELIDYNALLDSFVVGREGRLL
eukprot:g1058.t1